ncbi:MAG: hypothetical protein HKL85_06085 [Acidimicrobiaceae bacterium]|nr:hypothetical protein [Acidimicrobiaceae bacterium]
MNYERAHELLEAEFTRVHDLLDHTSADATAERTGANDQGDMSDSAEPLIAEQEGAAVSASLRQRLAAIERAQQRLLANTYGFSVRSGQPIPDERLEADPAAELTVDEALSALGYSAVIFEPPPSPHHLD